MGPTGLTHRETAIEAHLPLVRSIARRYLRSGEPLEDLVQAGTVGLIKAVDRYDPARHPDLAALARPSIEGEIRHHLRDGATAAPRVARPDRELAARVRALTPDLTARLRRAPTVAELADAADAGEDAVARALAADAARDTRPLGDGAGAGAVAAIVAVSAAAEARVLLESGWATLDDRERRLLTLRYHEDRSQSEIARELGLSQAHVSRLLRATLDRLRTQLAPGETPADEPEEEERSGRLLLRLPRTLHTGLARAAQDEGVPLNTYITSTLTRALAAPDPDPEPEPKRPPSRLLLLNAVVILLAALAGVGLLLQAWLG